MYFRCVKSEHDYLIFEKVPQNANIWLWSDSEFFKVIRFGPLPAFNRLSQRFGAPYKHDRCDRKDGGCYVVSFIYLQNRTFKVKSR
jgi:hypothetical protein